MTRPGRAWVRVRYGIYCERSRWQLLSATERRRLLDSAALLVCDDDAALSHSSAARWLGLPTYDVADDLSHVTRRLGGRSSRVQAGVKHHLAVLDSDHILVTDGIRVTDLLRTAIDMSREFGYRSGVVAADAALRLGADPNELAARVAGFDREPHAPTIKAVAEFADGRAQTPIESLGRILLHDMGITDVVPQYVINFDDGTWAEGDLYSPEFNHLFECDGRVKYRAQLNLRGEPITADDVVWLEKKREDKVRGLGTGCSRIYWIDVLVANFERARTRLWREVEQQRGRDHRTSTSGERRRKRRGRSLRKLTGGI